MISAPLSRRSRSGRQIGRRRQQLEPRRIEALALAPHRDEQHRRIQDPGDLVGADEERRVLVEEMRPVLLLAASAASGRRPAHRRAPRPLRFITSNRKLFAGMGLPPKRDRPSRRKRSKPATRLRLVDGVDGDAELRARGQQQPLPVAEMRGKQHDRLAALRALPQQLRILDAHAALHFRRARAVAIERLDDEVGEIAVRLLEDRGALAPRSFRETRCAGWWPRAGGASGRRSRRSRKSARLSS